MSGQIHVHSVVIEQPLVVDWRDHCHLRLAVPARPASSPISLLLGARVPLLLRHHAVEHYVALCRVVEPHALLILQPVTDAAVHPRPVDRHKISFSNCDLGVKALPFPETIAPTNLLPELPRLPVAFVFSAGAPRVSFLFGAQ